MFHVRLARQQRRSSQIQQTAQGYDLTPLLDNDQKPSTSEYDDILNQPLNVKKSLYFYCVRQFRDTGDARLQINDLGLLVQHEGTSTHLRQFHLHVSEDV